MKNLGMNPAGILWFSITALIVNVVCLWITVTMSIPQPSRLTSVGPIQIINPEFQKSTCSNKDDCNFKITPRTIIIHFVDKDEYKRTAPVHSVAYSNPYQEPCEAFIPATATINSQPEEGRASWGYDKESYEVSNDLAHEILHCYTGIWHGDWLALNLHAWHETLAMSTRFDSDVKLFRYRLPKLSKQLYDQYDWNKMGKSLVFYYPDEYITINHGDTK